MDSFNQIRKQRVEQLKNWKEENVLGFMLWETKVIYSNGNKTIELRLEQWQCKDGIYILQINDDDDSFLIFKTNSDICIK